jgi:hypothetical protein
MDQLGATDCEPWLEEVGPAKVYAMEENEEVVLAIDPHWAGPSTRPSAAWSSRRWCWPSWPVWRMRAAAPALCGCPIPATAPLWGPAARASVARGVSIGLQAKGTTVVHCRYMPPLSNLELFSQAPNLDLATYRQIGRNAARYARKENITPVPVKIDNTARLRLIVQTTLMHLRSTNLVDQKGQVMELRIKDKEACHA